jgi:hypothetical protein
VISVGQEATAAMPALLPRGTDSLVMLIHSPLPCKQLHAMQVTASMQVPDACTLQPITSAAAAQRTSS